MVCRLGYGAYRYEILDHRIPVRLVTPAGRPLSEHSRACSWIWEREDDKAKARRWISTYVSALNLVHNLAANDNLDVAAHFVAGVRECREIQDLFFKALNVGSVASTTGRDGSLWLHPKKHLWPKVADTLIAFGMITKALTLANVFKGQDPSKVNKGKSRIGGKVSELKVTRRGIRLDVDNRLRLGADPSAAPRYDDPRVADRLKEGLRRTGAPQVFDLMTDMAVSGGGRAMSILGLDLYDVFVRRKTEGQYPSRNKGDAPAERNFVAKPQTRVHDANLAWVDDGRKKLTGQSLEQIRRIAADPLLRETLIGQPLYTEDGVNFIKYSRLYRIVRKAAERMNLFIDDEAFRTTGVKRWVTIHLLRHEYVHRRLDYVDTLKSESAKKREKAAIVEYMKWKSAAMLDWYSKHHVVKTAQAAADAHNHRQDEALNGSANAPADVLANDAELAATLGALA